MVVVSGQVRARLVALKDARRCVNDDLKGCEANHVLNAGQVLVVSVSLNPMSG